MPPRLRSALAATSLLLALVSILQYRAWAGEQERLASLLDRAQVQDIFPGLADRVRRANDPFSARTRATRPLVAHYLNPTWLFDIPDDQRAAAWQRSQETLEEIRVLAADSIAAEPTSWEPPMLFGATTYLLQSRGDLSVSMSDLDTWEVPLRRAQELTPEYLEPARYLTVAYIQHWQSLSIAQRKQAEETLRRAFEDPNTFNLVIELWLRLVPDRREAMKLIPDEPFAWRRLEDIFRRKGEWNRYLETHQRYLDAEQRNLEAILAEAKARIEGGDYRKGTALFHQVAASIQPGYETLPLLQQILDRMPAGPVNRGAATRLREWLDWTLDLGFLRSNPLEAEQLRRLVGAVQDANLQEQALAAVMVDDLAEAERIERRRQGAFDERWGPYLILKARALLDRGDLDDARLNLLRVDRSWEQHPTYLNVRHGIAEARADVPGIAEVEAVMDLLPAESWRGGQMTWRRTTARLEIVAARSAPGLVISFLELPQSGRPMQVSWNGQSRGTFMALPGEPLRVEVEVTREPSLLEIQAVDNRPFIPGGIVLIGSEDPSETYSSE